MPYLLIPSVYQHHPFPIHCLSMPYLPHPFCQPTPSVPCSLSINALPSLSLLSINTFRSLFLVYQCLTFLIPSVYQHLPFPNPCLSMPYLLISSVYQHLPFPVACLPMPYLPYPFCLSTPPVPYSLSINTLPSLYNNTIQ